ncbi:MAG: hypothetical protein U0894_08855 [Pirellulales bacterium]
MKPTTLIAALLLVGLTSVVYAKRGAPAKVPPLQTDAIEYRISHQQLGCVQAWDTKHDQLLWQRQIYVVKYLPDLERDVQDVFITSIQKEGNQLRIQNERKSEYLLDLETLQVKVVKGALIESTK